MIEPVISRSRLEYYRRFAGLSRAELSNRSGVSAVMIGKYERHEKDLKLAAYITVKALADTLGVDPDELIDTNGKEDDNGTEEEKQG